MSSVRLLNGTMKTLVVSYDEIYVDDERSKREKESNNNKKKETT